MPTALAKADYDVTSLTVLGLLLTGPRHTYEIHRLIERTHKTYVTGLPRSVYHAVERLLTGGFIEVVGTVRDGPRPERTVYRLTPAGVTRLHEWVERLVAVPDANSTLFVPALSFAGCLPPATVAAALRVRAAALVPRLASSEAFPEELPRVLGLEAEYETSRLKAEMAFVEGLIDDLESGTLIWSTEPPDPAAINALIAEENP